MLTVVIGIVIGMGLPVQTSVNARLRRSVGSPFLASFVSFAVGTLFLGAVAALTARHWELSAADVAHQPWWIWLGGLLGVVFLTANLVLLPVLGAVQTVIIPALGQIAMGLLIDSLGWFGGHVVALSAARVIGAVLVAAGVAAAVVRRPGTPSSMDHPRTPGAGATPATWWAARGLGLAAGAMSATQTAINGHLGRVLGSPAQAALVSFTVGTVALALIVVCRRRPRTHADDMDLRSPWWMWTGGVLGGVFVLGTVHLAGQVGTGLTVLLALTGSITASVLIDRFGWVGTTRSRTRPVQILGVAVMLAGAVLTRLG